MHRPFPVSLCVLLFGLTLLAMTAGRASAQVATEGRTPPMLFGTMLTNPVHANEEYSAGIRLVHLELSWRSYEPTEGNFDAAYIHRMQGELAAFRRAGMKVVLGTGLQYQPAWTGDLPFSKYVNQDGVAVGPANLTFSPDLRERAGAYLRRVAADFGTDFFAVRIGSGGSIECFYPSATADQTHNSYWCYDAFAQKSCPFPGWKPGQREYNGKPFTTDDVAKWYTWYLGALIDGIDWQIDLYRRLGYTCDLQILMPGLGTRPHGYAENIAAYLDGSADSNGTMARGAVWFKVVASLKGKPGCVVYVSSVADGSGHDDLPQPEDRKVALDDPAIDRWSATRWLVYLADTYGLAKSGENPGRNDSRPAYALSMPNAAVAQATAGGFNSFFWAHDFNLYDGTGPTLSQYGAVIHQHTNP